MNDFLDLAAAKLAPSVIGFIAGPFLTLVAKKITALANRPLQSPVVKIGISTLGGALSAIVVGDINGLAEALGTLIQGFIGGFGGAKARDVVAGKTEVVAPQ